VEEDGMEVKMKMEKEMKDEIEKKKDKVEVELEDAKKNNGIYFFIKVGYLTFYFYKNGIVD